MRQSTRELGLTINQNPAAEQAIHSAILTGLLSHIGVKDGDKITPPVAVKRALDDVGKFEGAIKRCVKVPLTQSEYDAYASLAYNIGPAAFCGSTLVKKLNAGDYSGACEQVLVWDKFHGQSIAGLRARREREHKLCQQ